MPPEVLLLPARLTQTNPDATVVVLNPRCGFASAMMRPQVVAAALALRIARLSEERETAYSELYLLSLITHRALRRWHESAGESER